MKSILFLFISFSISFALAQNPPITLMDCVDSALANKANIKASNTELLIASLQQAEAAGKFLPQLSLAYDYRYNPILQTQILPVGEFKVIPDDEQRAIQFGTRWQQNVGLTLYQPLIDLSIRSKIAESKIDVRIKDLDLTLAEDELKYEVLKSFSTLYNQTRNIESFALDTARTFSSLQLVRSKFEEHKVLKTDLNKAQLNHNNALMEYQSATSSLVKEKIYLSFLTGIPLPNLLEGELDFTPLLSAGMLQQVSAIRLDSLPAYQQLSFQEALIQQQIKSERKKYVPTLGFEGFLGANQYANTFNPFLRDSWFGNSYVGLSVKMPFLLGENTARRVDQLENQHKIIGYNREALQNERNKDFWQSNEAIGSARKKIAYHEMNVSLMEENVDIFQERFSAGQVTANELNLQEIDLQKEKSTLLQLYAQLIEEQVDLLNSSGNLNAFLGSLR